MNNLPTRQKMLMVVVVDASEMGGSIPSAELTGGVSTFNTWGRHQPHL